MKRMTALLLCALLLIAAAGCDMKPAATTPAPATAAPAAAAPATPAPAAAATPAQAAATPAATAPPAKPIPTIKFVTTWDPGVELTNDSPIIQEVNKRLGVKLDITLYPRDNHKEKVNMLLASKDIPDMLRFFSDATSFTEYGAALFEPLDPYIADGTIKYMPEYFKKYPEFEKRMRMSPDGKVYGFGIVQDFDWTNALWYVRNDMLKKEGLDAKNIKTLDDMKKACEALKKVKGKDYITSTRLGWSYYAGYTGAYFGFAPTSAVNFDAYRAGGTRKYINVFTDLKDQVVAWLTFEKWMLDNKMLHPDFLTMKDQELFAGYNDGTFPLQREQPGVAYGAAGSGSLNPNNDPNIEVAPIVQFDVNGTRGSAVISPHYNIGYRSPVVVGKGSKVAADAMRVMDYFYSEEGVNLTFLGVEGDTFVKDPKTPSGFRLQNVQSVWTANPDGTFPAGMKTLKEMGYYSWWMSGVVPPYNRFNLMNFKEGEDEQAKAIQNDIQAQLDAGLGMDPLPDFVMSKEDSTEIANIMTPVNTYVSENLLKFILGQRPISEYDKFVEEMSKMGNIARVIEIQSKYVK